MLSALDHYYNEKKEPDKGCLLALKEIILKQDIAIVATWKYGMPFFYYQGKMLCYLWVHKKFKQPYIGIADGNLINHPALISEKRSRMKILLCDPNKDLPLKTIETILKQAIHFSKLKSRQ